MPTDAPGQDAPAPTVRPTGPFISASRGQVLITGTGFLPDCAVTVRITYTGEDAVDYLTYNSDADGFLCAALPHTAIIDTGHIAVTDHRPDRAGDGGLLWSNTVVVIPVGMCIRHGRIARDRDWEPFSGRSAQQTAPLPI